MHESFSYAVGQLLDSPVGRRHEPPAFSKKEVFLRRRQQLVAALGLAVPERQFLVGEDIQYRGRNASTIAETCIDCPLVYSVRTWADHIPGKAWFENFGVSGRCISIGLGIWVRNGS